MNLFPPPEMPAPAPPAPPTSPDDWFAPPARRRGRVLPIVLVVATIAVLTGAGTYWKFGRSSGPSYPKGWDPRIASLVPVVERIRGLDFKHPVRVEFLSDAAFNKQVSKSPASLSKKDRQDLNNSVAFLRALGLVNGNVDLLSSVNQAQTEGVLAYYQPSDKTIRIKGTSLDLATRVTLAHEMTHVLQDQHFDLQKLQHLDNNDESGAIDTLIEGDAEWVKNTYVESLSAADQREYQTENDAQDAKTNYNGIPAVIQIMFSSPYEFGPAFVEVLRDNGGQTALDAAFTKPPTDEQQIFDPVTFINHVDAAKVAKPTPPAGAKVFDSGTFDPNGWFIMLSERIDPHEALQAADGWGGDQYISYHTADNHTCQQTRFVGASPAATATMQRALGDWMHALPVKIASVRQDASSLLFQSCDPGTKVHLSTGRSLNAFVLPIARVGILQDLLKNRVPLATADCIANRIVATSTVKELNDPTGAAYTSASGRRTLAEIAIACRQQNG
jgi:hypothetical protein